MSFADDLKNKGGNLAAAIARRKAQNEAGSSANSDNDAFAMTVPGKMAGQQEIKWLENQVAELTSALNEERKTAKVVTRLLKDLHEVPGRRRKLSNQEYAQLKESIRINGMRDPIKCRPRPNGDGLEVISGHNRKAILEELGIFEAKCLIQESDDVETAIDAFFANLYQSDLPPYEKYTGFKAWREVEPELSYVEMARRTGCSKSMVTEVMSFEQLPPEVHALLSVNPKALGYRAAAAFASFAKQGHLQLVIEGIRSIVENGVDQGKALRNLQHAITPKKSKRTAEPEIIRSGRTSYCQLTVAPKVVRIEFEDSDEANSIKTALVEFLQQRAEDTKGKKN